MVMTGTGYKDLIVYNWPDASFFYTAGCGENYV